MKTEIKDKTFDQERALYGSRGLIAKNCRFDGPADGESAFKESCELDVSDCFFNLRYPFWHDKDVKIRSCELTELCRAALWYSSGVKIENSRLHGTKALRECADVDIENCDIISSEFGWFCRDVKMRDDQIEGEYLMMRSSGLCFENVTLNGKYSFQYIDGALFENCTLNTKDAFWHARNVTVKNCTVKGEYLGWYCENVTFENCRIIGTQPLCYCKGLTLIECSMEGCDLAFEKSDVTASITTHVDSIKNVASGQIRAASLGELILDDESARGTVIVG